MQLIDFLPVIVLSVIGSITDIKHGRVRNKHLLIIFLLWAVLTGIRMMGFGLQINWVRLAINVCLAFVASLVFYLTDIWAPGDCKMFILVAAIYPMYAYPVMEWNIFPSIDLIVYAFATGYVGLLVSVGIIHKNEEVFHLPFDANRMITLERLISIVSNFGIMASVNTILDYHLKELYVANQILFTLIAVGIVSIIQNKAGRLKVILGSIGTVFIVIIVIIRNEAGSFLTTVFTSIILSVLIETINNNTGNHIYKQVSGDQIRHGMILSYTTIMAMQNCIDPNIPHSTTESRRSRISESQAVAVKNWCKNAKSDVVIVEMMPFAPFIALAVLIEMLRYTAYTK